MIENCLSCDYPLDEEEGEICTYCLGADFDSGPSIALDEEDENN